MASAGTPAGDPVNAPVDGGDGSGEVPDGANEFTYSSAAPGILTVKLKAKVPGIGSLGQSIANKFAFDVDSIGNSTKTWDASNPGGKPTASGDFLTATVTFTGLPVNNSDFGKKKARVMADGLKMDEKEFEVFFPTYEKNHPNDVGSEPDSKNWYYYWKQTVAGGNRLYTYEESLDYPGETIYSSGWKAKVGPLAASASQGRGWNYPAGIDYFAWTVRHENKHINQLSYFWTAGVVESLDVSDHDWFPTTIEPSYMNGQPYNPDMRATYLDTIGYQADPNSPINDIEDICMRTQAQSAPPYGIDQLWTNGSANDVDWSSPGMQHQTLGKFDD